MKYSKGEKALSLFGVLVIACILTLIIYQASDCHDSGGKFVRGFIWFECINQ